MRLTLIIAHLGLGGAECILCTMADYWARKGWPVTLITIDARSAPAFYHPCAEVRYIDFDMTTARARGVPKLRTLSAALVLRRVIRQTRPDAVISFLHITNINVLMATAGMPVPVIVSERSDPRFDPLVEPWARRRRWWYCRAAGVVVLSHDVLEFFPPAIRRRACVIPNPVSPPPEPAALRHTTGQRRILAMGRLVELKRFDWLLRAFAPLADTYPEWSLEIRGDGPERQALETLAATLGLSTRVTFPGATTQPYDALRQADLFVLSSRYEGFPNVLCEAMACGVPVVSIDCPSGPREIVRHEVDGLLVPDGSIDALSTAMERMMRAPELRTHMGVRAREIVERFSVDAVMSRWEALLQQVVS